MDGTQHGRVGLKLVGNGVGLKSEAPSACRGRGTSPNAYAAGSTDGPGTPSLEERKSGEALPEDDGQAERDGTGQEELLVLWPP